ncbi:cysteine--tRNA ligase [Blochmannia endosymbiont of Colobopsis nipponica]|uniref:cysteine--tRNA ligase n=1 Tax=Blochmannia endosymbiont of Colobopsis nipponica TaxID=2681987 RepID=UPI0017841ABB|nr:cysteine--tRNA ligase [Blochmannia endosymbiont of Colobopsis nipponica]QOI11134.1 cysteine--tRNA ligase [Blochmannia endosymbiont of Colobopsis nipponica]
MLKIFNTLTRRKETFKPISCNKIKIYVCGVTVYDLCHIGHGRTFIIFDVIVRYLRYSGYQVNYIRNITDIDDKIIHRVSSSEETYEAFINRMIREMHYDFSSLRILKPNYEPRVTCCIEKIIELINTLLNKGHAYIASNGDVMFDLESYKNYGALSNKKILKNSIYTHVNTTGINIKRNPMDFVLWKMSKFNELQWDSPWGSGRPGWHIECSAMQSIFLGNKIDIHGGGSDLIFPHHENEFAQSTCAHKEFCVNIWMHSGLIIVNHEKMSKSLNNFFTIRDILKLYNPETVRFFLLSTHYRKSIKYCEDSFNKAHAILAKLYIALRNTDTTAMPMGGEHFISQFNIKMNDDFNIPGVYSILFAIAHEIHYLKIKNSPTVHGMAATLRYLGNILGLLYYDAEFFLKNISIKRNYSVKQILKLVKCRDDARKKKNWILADKIRDVLTNMGIILEDNTDGTTWRCK